MPYTTISIDKHTKMELKDLQKFYNARSMDELLKYLISQAKKKYIDDFSGDFQTRLKEKKLSLQDIINSGEEIRAQILKEKK
jgi:hypothetical protein